jgi:Delta7-sterol 5-desaturase
MDAFLDWANVLSPWQAIGWLILANIVTFALAVLLGDLATRLFDRRRIVPLPDPVSRKEILYTVAGVLVNTAVTLAGWWLWRDGWLIIRRDTGARVLLDFAVLLVLMDFGMYVLHRVAHLPWFFTLHRLHHEFDRPRALTLFVVHPLETLGFGLLWLAVILLYNSSWLGLSLYLFANLATGTLGHLGVEPFPGWWARVPVVKEVGTSTFHAQHHRDLHHNFGFYTLVWDRLFGTLIPHYDTTFGMVCSSNDKEGASQ